MADEEKIPAWTPEWYGFTERGIKWLNDHGCEWIKVEADLGDLILWDSRAPHYNVPSTTRQDRMAVYTCFRTVEDVSQEDLKRKGEAFEKRLGTTHWPNAMHIGKNEVMRDGEVDPAARKGPREDPVLSESAFKLTDIPCISV
jgi:hypothetical protein